jgi:hypothetical protein
MNDRHIDDGRDDRGGGQSPDPDPRITPGLDHGGGVPAGETPPVEGSMSGAGPREVHNPTRGWAAAPLIALTVVVAVFVGFFVAYAVLLAL